MKCKRLLYADDSALLASGRYHDDIKDTVNREFDSVKSWSVDNRPSLDLGKTEFIYFFGTKRRLQVDKMSINWAANTTESKKSVTHLRVSPNQCL